ncbi:hypothetical protein C8J56DRAFT_336847 [Mycena floridula]|nr:hypothetical protein C8J56DRAFT_336847 [Mycena floridula]
MASSKTLAQYESQRNELIQQDRSLRADHSANLQISETELAADKIVRQIRAEESASIWAADYLDVPHPFPGMEFLTGKSIMLQTKLFGLLKNMPKGALLHCHIAATVDTQILLKLNTVHPAMHVRTAERVTAENIQTMLPQFMALPKDAFSSDTAGLTNPDYAPGSWVSLKTARETFDPSLGSFDDWVNKALVINPSEAYGTHNTPAKIWNKFDTVFRVTFGLVRYLPVFAEYIREHLRSCIEDGISYVETRFATGGAFLIDEDGHELKSNRPIVATFERVVKEVREEMRSLGREDDFIGAKLIYCGLRFFTPDQMEWYMEECIAFKKEFPDTIMGFDLVGNEDKLKPLIYYIEPLLKFRARQKEENIDIPFYFHAGETLGDGTEADMNLYDAILLGTKRIGHGFSLVKHPKLMQMCREKDIALEVCPISNEVLRLSTSMAGHPLPILVNHGIPTVLASDDPAIFGNMGLTFDFYQVGITKLGRNGQSHPSQVLVSSEITGLVQIGQLARNSLKYSALEAEEKVRALAIWEKKWAKFLEYVIEQGQNSAKPPVAPKM